MNRNVIIERAKRIRYNGRYDIDDVRIGKILMVLDRYSNTWLTWSETFKLLYRQFLTTAERMEFDYNCNYINDKGKVIYIIKKYFKIKTLLDNE